MAPIGLRKRAGGNNTSDSKDKISKLKSLTDVAYHTIKDEILTNKLRPGESLPLERYINDLSLSRTPLREAVLRLEKEGLVEIKPRMGTFVAHLNLREIQEIYQVRRTLEGLAARLAAERIKVESLKEVETNLLRHSLKGSKINYEAISETGQSLHRFIINSCGNSVLSRIIQSLQDHFTRFRSLSLDIPEKVLSSHQEHLKILDALKKRDGELAEKLIHEHFDNAAKYLLENLLTSSNYSEVKVTISQLK
jgi:DNA-binding GntR family transcriptional regulator